MKKTIWCLVAVCMVIFTLCSCGEGGSNMLVYDQDNALADKRMEEVFVSLEQRNADAIVRLFSKNVVSKFGQINKASKDLLAFVEGDIISWNREESSVVLSAFEYSSERKKLMTWYTLSTSKQNYLIFLVDYPIDEIDFNNIGLYTLKIIKESDEESLSGSIEDWELPGIYISTG